MTGAPAAEPTLEQLFSPAANPATFGYAAFGVEPAEHHWAWLDAVLDPTIKQLLIVAPRESAKTTWLLIAMAWMIGNNPLLTHFIGSITDEQATNRLKTIKTIIESSPAWKAAFPHVVPDYERGWSTAVLYVKDTRLSYEDWINRVAERSNMTTPTVSAGGLGASNVVGSRFSGMVLIDDPQDEKTTISPLQRERAWNWLLNTLSNAITKTGKLVVIMTRWHRDDIAGKIKLLASSDATTWRVLETPAIDPKTRRSYWPREWPVRRLRERRASLGTAFFRASFLLDPEGLVGKVLQSDWFKPLPSPVPALKTVGIFLDLAISERQTADYTVIGTLGLDFENNGYILDVVRGRWSFHQQFLRAQLSADLCTKRWGRCDVVGIENAQYQIVLAQELMRETTLPIVPISPLADKVARARLWAVRAEQGGFFADRDSGWWPLFLDEMVDFPTGEHDDQVDVVSEFWQYVSSPAQFTGVW